MQIHGRLSDVQRKLIGAKDNNAPPILKIYWYKGLIRVKSKYLKTRMQLIPKFYTQMHGEMMMDSILKLRLDLNPLPWRLLLLQEKWRSY